MIEKNICCKCEREIKILNELEEEELKEQGCFICSDCINEEMEETFNALI